MDKIIIDPEKIRRANGGKKIKIGETEINVISGYSPTWKKEFADSFTTWDGRIVKPLKGIRFSLSFSTYGLQAEELTDLCDELTANEITLECDEYSGNVTCDDIPADLQSANFYGEFFKTDITLTADTLLLPEDCL